MVETSAPPHQSAPLSSANIPCRSNC